MELFYVEDSFPGCFYIEIYSPSAMNFSVKIPSNDRYALLLKEIGGLIPALMIVDGNFKQGIAPDQNDIELIKKFFSSHKFLQVNIELLDLLKTRNFLDTNLELPAGNCDEFLKLQQPKEDPSLIFQEYALMYLQYDPLHGDRDWKGLLESNSVFEIDLLIAQRALASGEPDSTVNETIYYGSPHAQQLPHPQRGIYATTVVAKAIECHTTN